MEAFSKRHGQTQLAIETPYRNDALLGALIEHLQPGTRLSIASGLTLPGCRCETRSVQQWRASKQPALGGRLPAVFSWLAG